MAIRPAAASMPGAAVWYAPPAVELDVDVAPPARELATELAPDARELVADSRELLAPLAREEAEELAPERMDEADPDADAPAPPLEKMVVEPTVAVLLVEPAESVA